MPTITSYTTKCDLTEDDPRLGEPLCARCYQAGDERELSAEQVAAYVAKYATKAYRSPGRHPRSPYR